MSNDTSLHHILSSTITVSFALKTLAAIIFTIIGTAWALYANGAFSPNIILSNEVSTLKHEKRLLKDNAVKSQNEINTLNSKLKTFDLQISQLNDKLELKQLKAQFKIEQSRMITQLIASCISSTSSGEDYKSVSRSESNSFEGGGSAAAVAITPVKNPQNGADIFSRCLSVYNTKLKGNFLHLVEQ